MKAEYFSATAKAKIEAAGGKCEVLEKKSEDSEIDDFLSNVNDTSSDMGSGQLIAPLLFGDLKEEVNRIKTLMIK